ncbi:MAG: 5'-3' exonuclease H3TH domain-containing protein [Candidatus Liptonbacteria bacterium]|nr:5'-3' exonuclease H3TH domain-containing protein [Candidatus Liptonbacteria bacterium]
MKTALLIDANSIIHRSFHALPPLTGPGGQPTGSLYGLASILLKLWREEKPAEGDARPLEGEARFSGRPEYIAALFDRPEPTFRKKKYEEYKAQRPPAPNELISQIIEAHELFKAFGIRTFEKPGFEADDLIASFAEKFKHEPDIQVVILTGDRDTLQIVEDEKVVVRTFKIGVSETLTYDEKMVIEKYGLRPAQLIDYKALTGDPSDNIKGVPGIGPKTAVEILKKYGTLEAAYAGLKNDPKLEKRLGPFRKEAELSKELVTLDRLAPVEISGLEELKAEGNVPDIKGYFEKLGFRKLIERLEKRDSPTAAPMKKKKEPEKNKQQAMF